MIDIEEYKSIVSELLDELPGEFFRELSGGVLVSDAMVIPNYAKENDLRYIGKSDSSYVFEPASSEKELSENVVRYYDIDKDHFRSFVKENFLGIL